MATLAVLWLMQAASTDLPALGYAAAAGFALNALQALLIIAVQINDDVHIHRDRRRAATSDR